jgi:hypothetical protein
MELNNHSKDAVRQLGESINKAIEASENVAKAIENLRELGYEPNLMLKLEIGLQEINNESEELHDEIELDLTDEDVRTLRRMKIKF